MSDELMRCTNCGAFDPSKMPTSPEIINDIFLKLKYESQLNGKTPFLPFDIDDNEMHFTGR